MDGLAGLLNGQSVGQTYEALKDELESSSEFDKLLKEIDTQLRATQQTDKAKADEEAARKEKEKKMKLIAELRAKISALQSKLGAVGHGTAAGNALATEISVLQAELFWLLFAL